MITRHFFKESADTAKLFVRVNDVVVWTALPRDIKNRTKGKPYVVKSVSSGVALEYLMI